MNLRHMQNRTLPARRLQDFPEEMSFSAALSSIASASSLFLGFQRAVTGGTQYRQPPARLPLVLSRLTHSVLATHIRGLIPAARPQHRDDLVFRETRFPHRPLLPARTLHLLPRPSSEYVSWANERRRAKVVNPAVSPDLALRLALALGP